MEFHNEEVIVMPDLEKLKHPIAPVYNKKSKILILGSFPSVQSREQCFFYAHPQNRFWKVLAQLYKTSLPKTVKEKEKLLLKHGIALWDVVAFCNIRGSADNTIKNVEANDIGMIIDNSQVKRIFVNGQTAARLYEQYLYEKTGIAAISLQSTSPANASCSLEQLVENWKQIL